ncbi:MAG: extracellular solute-binding protein [Hyphomicrobiales bacterium]|nr:extracellular solute-binding protein [Hyphomicrobiales bacterium]
MTRTLIAAAVAAFLIGGPSFAPAQDQPAPATQEAPRRAQPDASTPGAQPAPPADPIAPPVAAQPTAPTGDSAPPSTTEPSAPPPPASAAEAPVTQQPAPAEPAPPAPAAAETAPDAPPSQKAEPAPTEPAAPAPVRRHALSLIGEPKYGPDFQHFAYVNPNAPKGGSARLSAQGSFDSLNVATFKGQRAAGLTLIYDQLFDASIDEPSTEYALIAEWASHPDDFSSVTYGLCENARWHDGKPITPEDVIFSMETLKAGEPSYAQYYKNVVRAEKTGEREVTFYFDVKNNRELPTIVSQLLVLPKHYWTGVGADGQPRDVTKTTLEPPLGSGPYRIKEASAPRHIVYERVKDYWAADLPVRRGFYNFDELRFDYYRDQTVAFEAFKKGEIDFFAESSAKNWATGYDFPAVANNQVVKREIALKTPEPMQAFVMNTRRSKFSDARVRRAFNLAFDFEWANQNLFFGQYKRTGSYFQNTELAATGLPQGLELAILEEVRDRVPPEVFTTEYANPVNASPEQARQNRRDAVALLAQAGWTVRSETQEEADCGFFCRAMTSIGLRAPKTAPVLRNAAGEAFVVEFLLNSPLFERIVLPYTQSLERLGIKSTVRVVDAAQYEQRTDEFDFDIIVGGWANSESPGNEQRDFWGSEAADKQGSRNDIGVKNPAVDALIDKIIFAKDRETLIAASRALDRVLLWNHYLVPQWHTPTERVAYWRKFAHPETLPARSVGFLQVWWRADAAGG